MMAKHHLTSPWGAAGKDDKPRDNQPTPEELYRALDAEFHFDHDPCPSNPEGLRERDGLGQWGSRNYVNPPYSHKEPWIERAVAEQRKGNLTVMLLPVDTSTKWFHDLVLPNCPLPDNIRFVRGRLRFPTLTNRGRPAPFASMICIFRPLIIVRPLSNNGGL